MRARRRRDAPGAAGARPGFGLSHEQPDSFRASSPGGEQQRAAIARALVNNPKILLCDELRRGTSIRRTRPEIIELLPRINLKGTTVVVATHNQAVRRPLMRRRVVRLENGRILHDDESEANIFVDWGKVQFSLGEVFTKTSPATPAMQFTAIGTAGAITIRACSARFLYVRADVADVRRGASCKQDRDPRSTSNDNVTGNCRRPKTWSTCSGSASDERIVAAHYRSAPPEGLREMRQRAWVQRLRHLVPLTREPAAERVPRPGCAMPTSVPALVAAALAQDPGRRQGRLCGRHRHPAPVRARRCWRAGRDRR